MFTGSIVAIVTPFRNGKVDEDAYRELIEFQIEGGTSAIVPFSCGASCGDGLQEKGISRRGWSNIHDAFR